MIFDISKINIPTNPGIYLMKDTNDTIIYNVSQVYYKNFRVVVTIYDGSATFYMEMTHKSI